MKHTRTGKHILLSVLLTVTLMLGMLCPIAAAETAETEIKNPAAKLTVTSVKSGETVETLYELAEAAFYAAEQEAQSHDKTVTVTMLAPMTGSTFESSVYAASPITLDLGGFHHYIKYLSIAGECTLTFKNGTLTTCGAYASSPYT